MSLPRMLWSVQTSGSAYNRTIRGSMKWLPLIFHSDPTRNLEHSSTQLTRTWPRSLTTWNRLYEIFRRLYISLQKVLLQTLKSTQQELAWVSTNEAASFSWITVSVIFKWLMGHIDNQISIVHFLATDMFVSVSGAVYLMISLSEDLDWLKY